MAGPEQGVHQIGLGDVRVLVLVEEHGRVARALIEHDPRVALGDLDRAVDLVAEVDHPELALQPPVARRGLRELHALLGSLVHAVRPGVLQQLEPGGDVRLDLHRGHAVVLRLFVELEDLRDERGLPGRRGVLERHPVEDPRAELRALRLGQDARAGLEAGEHAVTLEERCREPVVVRDLRLLALGELQRGQGATDAEPQVVGGLVREREAQDVAREHALLGVDALDPAEGGERQVHDPRGHHRRLAGPGPGDQHAGFERPGDGRPLFVGGLGAHRGDDLARHGPRLRRAHPVTSKT